MCLLHWRPQSDTHNMHVVCSFNSVLVFFYVLSINSYIDWSISASHSASQNSEGHMESVQPINILFILICNNTRLLYGNNYKKQLISWCLIIAELCVCIRWPLHRILHWYKKKKEKRGRLKTHNYFPKPIRKS